MMSLRTITATLTALVAITAVGAAPAAAQDDFSRDGFFIGFGLGYGSLGIEDVDDREGGISGYFSLGGKLNDKVLLGVESTGWYKDESGAELTYGNFSGFAQIYPSETSNFFLKAGVGLATAELDLGVLGSDSDTGLGLVAGAGIDIPLGSRFALTPYANFNYGSFDGGSANLFQFGLGLNWY